MDASLNNLDVSAGSETLNLINNLQNNNGWSLNYLPQLQAPTVTSQPMSAGISLNGGAVFNVSANSSTPPAIYYQWYFDGFPLSDGADITGSMTSSLTVTNAGTDAIGEYFVVVSDDAGRIFGGDALLNITNLVYLVSPAFTPPNQFQFTVQSAYRGGAQGSDFVRSDELVNSNVHHQRQRDGCFYEYLGHGAQPVLPPCRAVEVWLAFAGAGCDSRRTLYGFSH